MFKSTDGVATQDLGGGCAYEMGTSGVVVRTHLLYGLMITVACHVAVPHRQISETNALVEGLRVKRGYVWRQP